MGVKLLWLNEDSGQATLDGVVVVATLALVLVSVTGDGITVALRIAGVARVFDVLGDFARSCCPPRTIA